MEVTASVVADVLGPAALTLAVTVFIVTYARLPWHATTWGRSIMVMALALLGLGFNTLLWKIDATSPDDISWAYSWPRVLAWWIVASVYVWKTCVAWRALKRPGDGE